MARLQHEVFSTTSRSADLLTAGTALAYDLTLVASNIRDFGDVPNLKLLDPRTGQSR
jgi:predicted nucleic acid-binding protein